MTDLMETTERLRVAINRRNDLAEQRDKAKAEYEQLEERLEVQERAVQHFAKLVQDTVNESMSETP